MQRISIQDHNYDAKVGIWYGMMKYQRNSDFSANWVYVLLLLVWKSRTHSEDLNTALCMSETPWRLKPIHWTGKVSMWAPVPMLKCMHGIFWYFQTTI